MLTRRQRRKFHILEIIEKSEIPIGASHVRKELGNLGIVVSEATVGRILIQLDQEGLTKREGYQGRLLTELGRSVLKSMQMQHDRTMYGEEFFKILDCKSEEELVQVLIARRAIERELTRLAAQNISPEIEAKMKELIKSEEKGQKITSWENDKIIHELIAKAAENKVLEAMLCILRENAQLAQALEFIRKKINSSVANDHKKIMQAIINRDPDSAEQAMIEHIENLIRDVNLFWKKNG